MKKITLITSSLFIVGVSVLCYSFKMKNNKIDETTVVSLDAGKISGFRNETNDVTIYKGIPFAAPPVGELRWKAPQPVQPWIGVKECNAFGPSPIQGKPVPFTVYTREFLIPEQPISEDCLYLNVWTDNKKAKKPVVVWIYGGGFNSGGASVPIYDGEAMAKKGVIFVSINYRVGVFGFLAHPELSKESPNQATGNYGLQDQIAALKWVKKNIWAFGGDPNNVTIAGQSAGSMSVNCLVASPLTKDLFKQAIAESGSFMINKAQYTTGNLQAAEQQGMKLGQFFNATSLAELRKIPAQELLKFRGRFIPVADGYVLPETVERIFAEGKENDITLLTGWNADEAFVGAVKNKDAYIQQIKDEYGDRSDDFLKFYPAGNNQEAAQSQGKISRDVTFAISGFKWANKQSEKRKTAVYVYNFNRKLPATPDYIKYGAFHTAEVAYVLDNLKVLDRPWTPGDFNLAKTISAYWTNFIKYGNPNGKGLLKWPAYNGQTSQAIVFDVASEVHRLPEIDELQFMLSIMDK